MVLTPNHRDNLISRPVAVEFSPSRGRTPVSLQLVLLFVIFILVCRSGVGDCGYKVQQLFDARCGIPKRCQLYYRVILFLPLMTRWHVWHRFLKPCLGSESLHIFIRAVIYITSAFEPSFYRVQLKVRLPRLGE